MKLNIFGEKLPLNDQLYFIDVDCGVIVFAPYEHFAALISEDEYIYLMKHPESDNSIPNDLRLAKLYGKRKNNTKNKKAFFSPTELTIFLGDQCNLKCVYCNAVDNRRNIFFPDKTIEAFKIFADIFNITNLSFFGNGEPLLYFDTLKEISVIAKQRGIMKLNVTTNGVLGKHTEDIVRFLVEGKFQTQISLDGNEQIHDLQRPTNKGSGSFREVMKTIQEFSKYGDFNQYCFCRLTLTDYALSNFKDILMFLYRLGFRKIRFAELIPEGKACHQQNMYSRVPQTDVVNRILDALLLAESLGIDLIGDYDPRYPSESGVYSCPYMAQIACSLNTDLQILCCMEDVPEWVIGNIDLQSKKLHIDYKKIEKIQKRNTLNFEQCNACPVKCGGGCTHYSHLINGNLFSPGDYPGKCDTLQQILAEYLKTKLLVGLF